MQDLKHWQPTVGDCYADCIKLLADWFGDDFVLCHGVARLTKDDGDSPAGTQFGHAWLECGDWVHDHKRPDRPLPRALYYRIGNIDPCSVVRYSRIKALRMILSAKHYGPWHDHPEHVAFNQK